MNIVKNFQHANVDVQTFQRIRPRDLSESSGVLV